MTEINLFPKQPQSVTVLVFITVHGHKMFYGAVRDVSEEMNQFQKLMFYQNRGN